LGPASHTPTPLEDVIDDDDDIFADAGEYRGIDLGESDDEDGKRPSTAHRDESGATSSDAPARRGWFGDDPTATEEATVDVNRSPTPSTDSAQGPTSRVPEDEEEEARLRPLASSTVPSIRAMLAADDALAAEEKRKARKEKRKKAA
jgi:IK cytokine